jgi:hypothetical protein
MALDTFAVLRRCSLCEFSSETSQAMCLRIRVDESQNSTVWASDKWKGIFKVKWIFVRDVPSA